MIYISIQTDCSEETCAAMAFMNLGGASAFDAFGDIPFEFHLIQGAPEDDLEE